MGLLHNGSDSGRATGAYALCNGYQHFLLEPKRALYDHTVTTAALAQVWVPGPGASVPREPWPGERWMVRTANGDVDMFDLADRCMAIWSGFL